MFEERVGRDRRENVVARIAQQFEEKCVRFAGGRGENEVVGVTFQFGCQRLACRAEAEGMGVVGGPCRAGHDLGQLLGWVGNPGLGRIRLRQVEDVTAALLTCGGEAVGGGVPVGALRKNHEQVRRAAARPLSMSARASAREDGTASMACWKVRIASSQAPFAASTWASVSRIR